MVRFGVFIATMAAVFVGTAGHAQRTRAPAPPQDAAPLVYVDAGAIVREANDRADRTGDYGYLDVPPVVELPQVVSRGGVTSYATNGAYLGGAGQRYEAGGSSVVTVRSGASYGYPEAVAPPRHRKRARRR
ncbi:hypothetical protein ABIC16_001776 [Sphingomonas sp. PvP055]